MSCLCQYFGESAKDNTKNNGQCEINETSELDAEATVVPANLTVSLLSESSVRSVSTSEVSASDLAASKTEIWLLKKELAEARISIESLENLVKTMIRKQNQLMTEMYELKRFNFELQTECQAQRDYQTLERSTMLREMHEMKVLLEDRTQLLDRTVLQNCELTNSLQDATEKIYMVGMKYLKLKRVQSTSPPASPATSLLETDSDSLEGCSSEESLEE